MSNVVQQEELLAQLSSYQHELERVQAIQAIKNCMAQYEYLHLTPQEIWKSWECFAMWRPDVTAEVSDWGLHVGPEAVRRFWESQGPHSDPGKDVTGGIFYHAVASSCIQVAGNGMTAKCTFMSPGFETMMPLANDPPEKRGFKCYWCWGKYGLDFIKNPETGEWKIWHFKWFRTIRNSYERNWYEDGKNSVVGRPSGKPAEGEGIVKSVFHRPYRGDEIPHPFPAAPEPYYDYDGSFRWLFGGKEMEERYGVQYPEGEYEKLYNVNYPEPV